LVGLMVNVVLVAGLVLVLFMVFGVGSIGEVSVFGGAVLLRLFVVNVFLAGFNLLFAFSMDGGCVLRALLVISMGWLRVMRVVAQIGQFMVVLFVIVGIFVVLMLLFIAVFVWIGAV
jgi:hypothetical protein